MQETVVSPTVRPLYRVDRSDWTERVPNRRWCDPICYWSGGQLRRLQCFATTL